MFFTNQRVHGPFYWGSALQMYNYSYTKMIRWKKLNFDNCFSLKESLSLDCKEDNFIDLPMNGFKLYSFQKYIELIFEKLLTQMRIYCSHQNPIFYRM